MVAPRGAALMLIDSPHPVMYGALPCARRWAIVLGAWLASATVLQAGQPAPPTREDSTAQEAGVYSHFVLPTLDGRDRIALSDFRGRPVLVVHFAAGHAASREALLELHKQTAALVKAHKLWLLPVAHDHYADRVRVFASAHGIAEPIAHDLLNLTESGRLPRRVYVPRKGAPRELNGDEDVDKLLKTLGRGKPVEPAPIAEEDREQLPETRVTRRAARDAPGPEQLLAHADALVLAGKPPQIDEAIEYYRQVTTQKPDCAEAQLRLGIAYRIRFDRPQRQPGDLAAAMDAWAAAARRDKECDALRLRLAPFLPTSKGPAPYEWLHKAIAADSHLRLDIEPLPIETGDKIVAKRVAATDAAEAAPEDRTAVRIETAQHTRRVSKADHVTVIVALIPDAADGFGWATEQGPTVRLEKPATGELDAVEQAYAAKYMAWHPAGESATPGDDSGTAEEAVEADAQGGRSRDGARDGAEENGADASARNPGERLSDSNVYDESPAARPRLVRFQLTLPVGKRAKGMTLKGAATYSVIRGDGPAQEFRQPFEIALR